MARAKPQPPQELTEEHRRSIEHSLRVLADMLPQIESREQCGIDCKEYRDMRDHLIEGLTQLRETFFPRVPKRGRK